MRPDNKYMSDLDYLAEAGYDKFPGAVTDLNELHQRFNAKLNEAQSPGSFSAAVVSVAMLLISTIAFNLYDGSSKNTTHSDRESVNEKEEANVQLQADTMTLEPVTIVPENFTRGKRILTELQNKTENQVITDTIQVVRLTSKNVNDSAVAIRLPEPGLKFSYNSEVTYIHDLKITEYSRLYFKRQINDYLNGMPAAYASSEGEPRAGRLRQEARMYLHDQLSEALLCFRKGDYGRCIYLFNETASYNTGDLNCSFYTGMSYYYRRQYKEAITRFDHCLESSNNTFAQEAEYYKALCLQETGQTAEANKLLSKISGAGGFYASKAAAALQGR